jgi:hypothetical protein
MADILSKDYASYMEQTLKDMIEMPVEGICIITKLKGGFVYTSYYNSTMMDKLVYAGLVQQDAMLDTLRASKTGIQEDE